MASFNKVILVGYLGRDPELKYTPAGDAVCNFSVATSERRKNRDGEQEDLTTWFRVTCWRRQAEIAHEYLHKGSQVYVEGKLRQEEYTDRDGNRRTNLEVNASEIQFLGTRADGEDSGRRSNVTQDEANRAASKAALSGQAPSKGKAKQARLLNTEGPSGYEIDDSEIPF